MPDDPQEETLSLSLVDGITCGLAAALLLFVMFGINLAASTATLSGTSGHGTSSANQGDISATEPVDVVIQVDPDSEVHSDSESILPGSHWANFPGSRDAQALDRQTGRQVFARRLPGDVFDSRKIKGWNAPPNAVGFTLAWKGGPPYPQGSIHVFRTGRHDEQPFHCSRSSQAYNIITGFDLAHGKATGDCS